VGSAVSASLLVSGPQPRDSRLLVSESQPRDSRPLVSR
jgi:hypothetical protein